MACSIGEATLLCLYKYTQVISIELVSAFFKRTVCSFLMPAYSHLTDLGELVINVYCQLYGLLLTNKPSAIIAYDSIYKNGLILNHPNECQ